jgi:hypothetical protein
MAEIMARPRPDLPVLAIEYPVPVTPVVYYLAGPMSGHPQFNHPLFRTIAQRLRDAGYMIVNPADLDSVALQRAALESNDGDASVVEELIGESWGDVLARDVKVIADEIDEIIVLPEWWTSRGARLEVYVAYITGKPVNAYTGFGQFRPLKPGGIERGLVGLPVPISEFTEYGL